jgi:hypothetical protein
MANIVRATPFQELRIGIVTSVTIRLRWDTRAVCYKKKVAAALLENIR